MVKDSILFSYSTKHCGVCQIDNGLPHNIFNILAIAASQYQRNAMAGGKEAFIWGAIKRVADKQRGLVTLFITDADLTVCRSQERYSAFRSTFLAPERPEGLPPKLAGLPWPSLPALASPSVYAHDCLIREPHDDKQYELNAQCPHL